MSGQYGIHFGYRFGGFFKKNIFGTNGDDVIFGSEHSDTIFGFRGGDTISAGAGSDTVFGSRGDDLIDGGKGNDRLFGDKGNDGLVGGDGNDEIGGGRTRRRFSGDVGGLRGASFTASHKRSRATLARVWCASFVGFIPRASAASEMSCHNRSGIRNLDPHLGILPARN